MEYPTRMYLPLIVQAECLKNANDWQLEIHKLLLQFMNNRCSENAKLLCLKIFKYLMFDIHLLG